MIDALLDRWHAWAAASATRRQRRATLSDLDFDLPRPPMARADAIATAALFAVSAGFVVWVVRLLAGDA